MSNSVNRSPLLNRHMDHEEEINVRDSKPLLTAEPEDKFYSAYFIFYLLGVVSLIPWNFFITADEYWSYKFRNVSLNVTMRDDSTTRNTLQTEFTSYLNLATTYPNLIMLILNTVISQKISINKRIFGSLTILLLLMSVTLIFVNVNTDTWQRGFLYLTLSITLLLNMTTPIFGGSISGVVGKFSPGYITAVVGGQALGGIFAALTQIAALAIGASPANSAIVYFTIGNLTIILGIISYALLSKSEFFNYHVGSQSKNPLLDSLHSQDVSYGTILKKMWPLGFCIFFNFVVTMCLFPGIMVLIESEGKGQGNAWHDLYFVPTVTYLLFNVGDYVGRLVAGKVLKPKSTSLISLLMISRVIFVPLILLCNIQPRHELSVIFDKDYQYVFICFAFAFTNGYMMNIVSILIPRVVDHHEKEVASIMAVVFLAVGSVVGSSISLLLIRLL